MSIMCRTDVTAVKLYKEYILAGIGSWLNVFDRKSTKLIQKLHALNGQKIYHFVPSDKNEILVIGGKQFTVITWESNEVFVKSFDAIVCNDWLHSGVWVGERCVALLTAHNVVQKWDIVQKSMVSQHISKENSILYSGLLLRIQDDILVFSGTVFSQVLIHRCGRDVVLHSLKGHKGVIFSVSCSLEKGVIVTTSDDRAVRIWQLQNNTSYRPNSIGYWENVNITCIHELYGHLSRVMRNCIRDDFVISIGEDSCICFWGYDGNLLRKVTSHQNACIWSLDADDKHLVTGGGDSSVILHPLSMVLEYGRNEVVNIEVPSAKKVIFTARRNIIILTETNLVYNDVSTKSSTTFELKHESTCKLLSISSCKQIVAVVDMFGKLDIFIETCKGAPSIQNFIDTKLQIGKLLFVQWTGNRHLVLCSENGTITVLASRDNSVDLYANFILPPCKERWLTAAAMNLNKDVLVVGDRCGSLHIYVTGQKNPLRSFKKVHGRYGPTSINFESNKIITTGRCGNIKYFTVDKDSNVNLMSSRNLEFQWIEKFVDKEKRYISGFHERSFIIYDLRDNSKLLEVSCGGGHRSWDVIRYIEIVGDSYEEFIKFVYLKNSNINIETFELNKIVSKNVINGTHSKEINCLKTNISTLDDSTAYYISGGEDTSLRISSINSNDEFRDEIIFKQLSNVRTLRTALIENDKLLLVSAGGRAQICIKLLHFSKDDNKIDIVTEELIDYLIKGTDKERKGNQTWRNCSVDFDPETRIMDVDIIKCVDNFIIVAGCSDAYLRVFNFKYDGQHVELNPLQQLKHDTCILKTLSFEYGDKIVLITCTTRGIVTFWEISNTDNLEKLQFKPFMSLPVHQSGINSVACKITDYGILLATGGDDNMLCLNLIKITKDGNTHVTHKWMSSTLHCSQITGVVFVDDVIVTTSIDQRVTMVRWEVSEGIQCKFVSQVFSDVADIQGLDVLKCDSASITVCVFGKGFEVISMPRPSH